MWKQMTVYKIRDNKTKMAWLGEKLPALLFYGEKYVLIQMNQINYLWVLIFNEIILPQMIFRTKNFAEKMSVESSKSF